MAVHPNYEPGRRAGVPQPFVLIAFDNAGIKVNIEKLQRVIRQFVDVEPRAANDGWTEFATAQQLVDGTDLLLPSPTWWASNDDRWFAVSVGQAGDQVHIYFGWTSRFGAERTYDHMSVAQDIFRWLRKAQLAASCSIPSRLFPPKTTGELYIAGQPSGLHLQIRDSLKTVATNKDNAAAILMILAAAMSGILRGGEFTYNSLVSWFVIAVACILTYWLLRWFFSLFDKPFSWAVREAR